jgi:hypothetical protein
MNEERRNRSTGSDCVYSILNPKPEAKMDIPAQRMGLGSKVTMSRLRVFQHGSGDER